MRDWRYKGKATAWNGISNYLAENGFKASQSEHINSVIKEFLTASNLPYEKRNGSEGKNARQVQNNWILFVKFIGEKKTKINQPA